MPGARPPVPEPNSSPNVLDYPGHLQLRRYRDRLVFQSSAEATTLPLVGRKPAGKPDAVCDLARRGPRCGRRFEVAKP